MNLGGRISKVVWAVSVSLICIMVTSAWAEEVKVGAGAAPSENILKKIQGPMEKDIGLKLVLIDCGPYDALISLDKDEVAAAAGGLTFGDWLGMMEKKGYQIPDKNAYKYRAIGKDIIKVIVHKDIGVKDLSKDQLKGIFTGKISNWKEVGGPDQAIVVVFGTEIPGTNQVFNKLVMNNEPYTKKVLETKNAPDVKEKVKATPGAVGLAPITLVDDSVTVPKIPEAGRPITLITRDEPSGAVAKMLEYLHGQGKQYVTQ